MKENLPKTTTTTTSSAAIPMNSDFRPVYVSPLKYRPLLGLSASDSRLLLEKRVSLLGKPLFFIQFKNVHKHIDVLNYVYIIF